MRLWRLRSAAFSGCSTQLLLHSILQILEPEHKYDADQCPVLLVTVVNITHLLFAPPGSLDNEESLGLVALLFVWLNPRRVSVTETFCIVNEQLGRRKKSKNRKKSREGGRGSSRQ